MWITWNRFGFPSSFVSFFNALQKFKEKVQKTFCDAVQKKYGDALPQELQDALKQCEWAKEIVPEE